ncbi:MAG: DUF420 domain-containing protein [Candidatus Binatia bacterium]
MTLETMPALNAALNGLSGALLVTGYRLIRLGKRTAHKTVMLSALGSSALFLVSYLYYHYHVGTTPFTGTGFVRSLYFTVLISHTLLAASLPLLVVLTVTPALRSDFSKHRRFARWTLPIWLYVSITGVVVYFMLYHLFPTDPRLS